MRLCLLLMVLRFISDFIGSRGRRLRYARLPVAPAEMMHEAVLAADGMALHI